MRTADRWPPTLQALPEDRSRGARHLAQSDRVTVVLIAFASLLFLLPSSMVFGPLGGSGTPANLLGLVMAWLWVLGRLHPDTRLEPGRQPVRTAVLVYLAAVLMSVAAAAHRPIVGVETVALDRGALVLLGGAGVTLLAADGISTRRQLDRVVSWLVALATVVAVAGIVQFIVGFDIRTLIHVPGLTENIVVSGIGERSTFRRVSGTAAHPIEFAVVLAIMFPLALHRSIFSEGVTAIRRWGPLVAIGLALPMSLSRSGFVALAVAMLVLLPTWPAERRRRGLLAGGFFLVCTRFMVPGLLGTMQSLFTNVGNDPSIDGRTEDYAVFGQYFSNTPVLGRGFFTFIPDRYTTFDNQYMVSLVETGLVGTAALIGLFIIGMGTARGARRRSQDEESRHLGQALAASLAGALIAFGTFDALSFPMVAGCIFLLLGVAGASWRLSQTPAIT